MAKKIKQYYQSDFQYSAGVAEETRIRKRSNIILKKLVRFHPQGKTLLDIGSGYGYFLDEAKNFSLKTIGIEPSKKLIKSIPVNQLTGTITFNGTLEEYIRKPNCKKFDFITAVHVIEHVSNPIRFIKQATALLNRNGILYIETPNYNGWLAKIEKEHYTFLTPPDHIWLFSLKSLQSIVVRFPRLSIKSVSSYSYPEHFMGIVKKLVPRHPKGVQIERSSLSIGPKLEIKKLKFIKYALFDKLLAPLFTPLLNIGIYGSILELYIRKKQPNCGL